MKEVPNSARKKTNTQSRIVICNIIIFTSSFRYGTTTKANGSHYFIVVGITVAFAIQFLEHEGTKWFLTFEANKVLTVMEFIHSFTRIRGNQGKSRNLGVEA